MFTLLSVATLVAPLSDSLNSTELDEVVVNGKTLVVSKADTVQRGNLETLVSALDQLPSIQTTQYGGSGSVNTVSLRGMGSASTEVYIDGLKATNVQSGQVDLSNYSNCSTLAIDFAQNALHLNTTDAIPQEKFTGNVSYKLGSGLTESTENAFTLKLNDSTAMSLSFIGLNATGEPIHDTLTNRDTRRGNWAYSLWGHSNHSKFKAKASYNKATRGVPGSSAYPTPLSRQADENFYTQAVYTNTPNSHYTFTTAAKFATDYIGYHDAYTWGGVTYETDSYYEQYATQFAQTHTYTPCKAVSLQAAFEVASDVLNSSVYTQQRVTADPSLAVKFAEGPLDLTLTGAYTFAMDAGYKRKAPEYAAQLNIKPNSRLAFNGFVRRAYRIPTFNELYFTGYGNPDLNCEDAILTSLGFKWARTLGPCKLTFNTDYFHNSVKDKIVSTQVDEYTWAPMNIGHVNMNGLESSLKAHFGDTHKSIDARVAYALTSALDRTDGSATYGQQINYTAKHALSGALDFKLSTLSLKLAAVYRAGRNDATGPMDDYATLDATFQKTFELKHFTLDAFIQGKNITDTRYEIASGYAMPGAAALGGVNLKW